MAKGERKVRKREVVEEGRECLLPHFGDNELLDQLSCLCTLYADNESITLKRNSA